MFSKLFDFALLRVIHSKSILRAAISNKSSFAANYSLINCSPFRSSHHISSQHVIEDLTEEDKLASDSIIDKVNKHIANGPGRLFAIIQIAGKQYRVVENDLVLIERNWAPKQNDTLIFEKVLLVGGASFTLIGKPILPRNVVTVAGTIVSKDLTHTKLRYFTVAKERIHHLNFVREELTYIRINTVRLHPEINNSTTTQYLRS